MASAPQASAVENDVKELKFGNRLLTDPQNVFQHNAWDNVVWNEEQEEDAKKITEKQQESLVDSEKRDEYESKADAFWDTFYGQHQNRFFKDRHWLFTEFPELHGTNSTQSTGSNTVESAEKSANVESPESTVHTVDETPVNYFEVGCGVGNTVFPVLNTNKNPNLKMYCCDFSSTAIQILKEHPDHDAARCHAFVCDITQEKLDLPFEEESLDVIIMIFVLSAVCPEKMQSSVSQLASYLKPGGVFLFRDYGRYDMAQLRFKQGRCLSENFYVRGDGTRVYFFTQGELKEMFENAGLQEKENLIDRRLQVNRGRQLKMYRVWIQCKYVKPTCQSADDS